MLTPLQKKNKHIMCRAFRTKTLERSDYMERVKPLFILIGFEAVWVRNAVEIFS